MWRDRPQAVFFVEAQIIILPTTMTRRIGKLKFDIQKPKLPRFIAHAERAGELGYVELKLKVEEMAVDETGHARKLRRILKGL